MLGSARVPDRPASNRQIRRLGLLSFRSWPLTPSKRPRPSLLPAFPFISRHPSEAVYVRSGRVAGEHHCVWVKGRGIGGISIL
jgi:hypothetical protein